MIFTLLTRKRGDTENERPPTDWLTSGIRLRTNPRDKVNKGRLGLK